MSENKVWRPLKFKSVEELQNKIDEYFLQCTDDKWLKPITITWLALYLDTDRITLISYQNKDEYSNTIKNAKLRVEQAYEHRLIRRWSWWDIFALKNFNWIDKQEIQQDTTIKWTVDISTMTPDQMTEYIKNAKK